MLTKEELEVIHHYVLLSIAKRALEMDLQQLQNVTLKLREPYIELTSSVLEQLSKELGVLKRYMRQHHLRVEKGKSNGQITYYHYFCRGYEGKNHYLNVNLKNQVFRYISSYFSQKYLKKSDGTQ